MQSFMCRTYASRAIQMTRTYPPCVTVDPGSWEEETWIKQGCPTLGGCATHQPTPNCWYLHVSVIPLGGSSPLKTALRANQVQRCLLLGIAVVGPHILNHNDWTQEVCYAGCRLTRYCPKNCSCTIGFLSAPHY